MLQSTSIIVCNQYNPLDMGDQAVIIKHPNLIFSLFQLCQHFLFPYIFPCGELPAAGIVQIGMNYLTVVGLNGNVPVVSRRIQDTQNISARFWHLRIINDQLRLQP